MTSPRATPLILVVDDDAELRQMVMAHLSQMHCELLEAPDGDAGLSMIISQQPDLILLDVRMPGLSGWEVAKYVREHEEYNHIGLIMVTGIGENLNDLTPPLYGADEYIHRPFQFSELDFKIRKTLAKHRRAAQKT